MRRPAFQFYPADWRKDAALQSCSLTAQGLWINIMSIAHECEPYGHLNVNGNALQAVQLGRLVGLSGKECERLLVELEGAGVYSRTAEGAIFSRRMVRDEEHRNIRAEGGKTGAEHGIKGSEYGGLGGRPKGGKKPPLYPPPSSSSSSSSSEESKALSGKPDVIPLNGKKAEALEVLAFLNEKTGRRYRPVPASLRMIEARLAEGASLKDCRQVIAKKCREWETDEKMEQYLRPATLFNATKFASYVGELIPAEELHGDQ